MDPIHPPLGSLLDIDLLQFQNLGKGLLFTKQVALHVEAYIETDLVGLVSDRISTAGCCTFFVVTLSHGEA